MFTSVNITRYRSCIDVSLSDLTYLTALAGRNGAGKTNVLRAMSWFAESSLTGLAAARSSSNSHMVAGPETRAVSATIRLSGVDYTYHVGINDYATEVTESLHFEDVWIERVGPVIQLSFHPKPLRFDKRAACLPAVRSLLPDAPEVKHVTELLSFLSSVHYYALEVPDNSPVDNTNIIPRTLYQTWVSGSVDAVQSSVIMRLLHLYNERPEGFNEVASLLGDDGLGLIREISIDECRPKHQDEAGVFYWVKFFPTAQPNMGWSYRELSAGTKRVLNLITSIVYDRSSVMLVEHPEDAMHDALLRKVLSILRSNCDPLQVFLTTHSPVIFDLLDPDEIKLVSMDDGRTSVRALTPSESDAASRFIQHEGSLSDFLATVQDG